MTEMTTPTPTSRRGELLAVKRDLHPLMQRALEGYHEPTPAKRAWLAVRLPFGALKLLVKNASLWPWAAAPAAINLAVLTATLVVTLPLASSAFSSVWAWPELLGASDYFFAALWVAVYLVVLALTAVLSYMSAMLIGSVIASPFNDVLSEKTEKILLGEHFVEEEGAPFLPSLLRSMWSSAIVAAMYFAIMAPLLFLHFVPVVGSVTYTLIGGVVGGYFVALEYSDTLLERRHTPFKQKLARVWEERGFTLGFGVGTSLMLAIPIVNFLCLPIAVIAGTAVGTTLLEEKREPSPAQLEHALE